MQRPQKNMGTNKNKTNTRPMPKSKQTRNKTHNNIIILGIITRAMMIKTKIIS